MIYPTLRVESYEESSLADRLRENLDFLEEQRAEAHLPTLAHKKNRNKTVQLKGQASPELGRPLLSRENNLRGDLRLSHDERKTIAKDMAHIELTKVLCINTNG
ncbi:hypothetical protein B296_00002422 [Ensete ventricosum]|uniref:Uncharacterized protein n=1 Tax=Ensete ventricosum TaxID=4639 RepID=A0A427B5B0_ENSVE|nr:hypothetical protein B296_00002422 [Ensete ventricosum]